MSNCLIMSNKCTRIYIYTRYSSVLVAGLTGIYKIILFLPSTPTSLHLIYRVYRETKVVILMGSSIYMAINRGVHCLYETAK